MRDTKDLKLFIKALDDDAGTFTGLASVYGNVDLGGDVVEPGAFAKSLADRGGEVPILWQHDPAQPIGVGKLKDTERGLQVDGELVLDMPTAKGAYAMLKKRVIRGLSIGFEIVKSKVVNGVRHLIEIKLHEVSLVTFPMNELAQVSAVKAEPDYAAIAAELKGVFAAARLK
jgi:uncharacterized protein